MLRYDVRFWDKANKRLIYGAGISPEQKPLVKNDDGSYTELEGDFVPMICTGQKALNGVIFEADVIECDVAVLAMEGLPPTYMKTRGVMQFVQATGAFTLNIQSRSPEMEGLQFRVTNSRIIGCVLESPELLKTNKIQNNDSTQIAETSVSASQAKDANEPAQGN